MAKPIAGLTEAARHAGMTKGGYMPMGMIRWSVGQKHVSESYLSIAREYWHKRAKQFPTPIKRACVRAAIREHCQNRKLYSYVMSGGHGYR